MADNIWSTLLAITGAIIGFMIGGPMGAQMGWFIGSTVGSYLDLEDSHTTTSGPRITDFKTMSSKYGIPIFRGYGTVRMAANIIWQSAVTEWEESETTCVKTKGFLGTSLGETNQCSTKITFKYAQSAAFAFAEGPATSLTKMWADGKIIYSTESSFLQSDTIFSPPLEGSGVNGAFSIYLGTLDQPINPAMREDLGDDAVAHRSLVYVVAQNLNLTDFGNRLPVLTAEISFSGGEANSQTSVTLDAPIQGYVADVLGAVSGHPEMSVGVNTANGSIAVHSAIDGSVFIQNEDAYPSGAPTGYVQLSDDYIGVRRIIHNGENYFGPFYVESGRQISLVKLDGSEFGQIAYSAYERSTNRIWATFTGGACVSFSLVDLSYGWNLNEGYGGYTSWLFNELLGQEYAPITTNYYAFTNGSGTAGEGREIFLKSNGRVVWLVDGPGGVWVNETNYNFSGYGSTPLGQTRSPDFYYRVQFDDDTNVSSVAHWTVNPWKPTELGSTVMYVDVAGTEPVGLYKVQSWDYINNIVKLVPSSDPIRYLNIQPADGAAFQYGPVNDILRFALNSNDLAVVDVSTDGGMTLIETLTGVLGGLGTAGTIPFPTLGGVRGGAINIVYLRGVPGTGQSLASIVTDLMTVTDGDLRERLLASDIDVTELEADNVRGYPLLRQQSVRNAITPLQQLFMFDAVESDGKIKFVKRPQTQSFAMVEDDLAAHEHGKTASKVLIPVEYERQAEIELPREVTINYTDFDLDYNQGTQRYRRQHTESHSNTALTMPIVLLSDEAAQLAERILNVTWSERTAPFKFKTGMKHCLVESTDTGTITMNDGKVYTVRIASTTFGANNVMEFIATNEIDSVYESSAVGSGSLNETQELTNSRIIVRIVDTSAGFLPGSISDQPGVIVGLGSYGTGFGGGSTVVYTGGGFSSGGSLGATEGMTFGYSDTEVGHVGGPQAENIFDYETVIVMKVLGGSTPPTSKTESEALSADASGLLLLGREIIAFTDVSCTTAVTVTGTDISFVNASSSINSTTTDFLAAGFETGMPLRLSGASNNDNATYWEISSVTQYQIVLTTAPTDESAGASISVSHAESTCTFSGGLLRGLYGTEKFMYHQKGEEIILAENLIFVPVNSATTSGLVSVTGTPTGGGKTFTDTTSFTDAARKPLSPTDADATDLSDDILISWVRRDKVYGLELTDDEGAIGISELSESWEIDILDGYEENTETSVVRTVTGLSSSSFTYTEAQQIADWGAVRETPFLIDIYQISTSVGRGFPLRTVIDRDSDYAPAGESFVNETPGLAYSAGTVRMNVGSSLIEGSGDVSPNALRMITTVDSAYTVTSFDNASTAQNIEVLAIVEMQTGSFAELTGGIVLRGKGSSTADLTGMVIGLGGASNNIFGMKHYVTGSAPISFSDFVTFAWTTGTKYSIRARYYLNRVQAKVWEYGDPEPGDWQLDYYDKGIGPTYGWIGPFAYRTGNDPLYHYFAWAHRGLTAA